MSVGFASWNIGENGKNEASIEIKADNISLSKDDFKGSAYFVKGSEKGFDAFEYNSVTYYSKTIFSCQIKVRPDLAKTLFANEDKYISIGLSYESSKISDINVFDNSSILIPDHASFTVDSSINAAFLSTEKTFVDSDTSSGTISHLLKYSVPLMSIDNASLSSISLPYQNKTDYVVFDVEIPFSLKTTIIPSFKNISFSFFTNLEESSL